MDVRVSPVEISRHKCLIYDGHPSQQLPVVVPLLRDGLRDNWRCLYLGNPDMVKMIDTALSASGIDTEREAKRGALVFSSDRSHLVNGAFDPKAMIDGLCASIDDALGSGFEGLCATGDMKWELGADDNFDHLLEYEARLELVFQERPLRGICQYHQDLVPARAVREALFTHRSTYVGDVLNRDNLFYLPPELVLESDLSSSSKQGEWMCQQILRVLKAERGRDEALTALRRSEAEQRRLAEQLAELNRDLERRVADRTAELEVANRHLEAFSYSVSHDLRAPLRAISGFSDILAEDFAERLGDEGRVHLDRVRTNASHMNDLIEGMLDLGRVIKADLRREAVDLSAIAEEVAQHLRMAEPARVATFVIEPDLLAEGDPVLLRVVVTNLIGNAWKFTSKRATARIEFACVGEENGNPVFLVRDNGAGFDSRYAKKLFGVFQRLHRQDEFPGHGVGLATVERVISRHGGKTWAESRPDAGAKFFFTLPRVGTP